MGGFVRRYISKFKYFDECGKRLLKLMLVAVIFRSDIDVPKFDHRAPARIALPTSTRFRSTAPDHGRV
jgi:hypothetical protein